jgi:hypothetical protein
MNCENSSFLIYIMARIPRRDVVCGVAEKPTYRLWQIAQLKNLVERYHGLAMAAQDEDERDRCDRAASYVEKAASALAGSDE